MKLYDKKFLIYGNCMIRSFGQPGKLRFSEAQGANVNYNRKEPAYTCNHYQEKNS